MANTNRVDTELFQDEHYLGKPADETDKIIYRRLEILKQYPSFFNDKANLIEVGCGSGITISKIANDFNNCLGVDIYDYSKDFALQMQKQQVHNCDFKKVNIESEKLDQQFDRLISFEVIEHLREENSVAEYHALLKENGIAAFTVPNKWWIFETHGAHLPLLPWNRVPFFSWLPRPIHERFANARIYTKKRILRLLQKSGFEILDSHYITAPMDVLKEGKLKRWLTKYIFKNNTTRVPFLSTSIFVLAKKQ